MWYGIVLKSTSRGEEAFKAFEEALRHSIPEIKTKIYIHIARACEIYRTRKEAEGWYSKSFVKREKITSGQWEERGENLSKLSRFDEERECFKKALESSDDSIEKNQIWYLLGLTYRAEENFNNAQPAFQTAIEENPNNKEVQSALRGLEGIEKTIEEVATIN